MIPKPLGEITWSDILALQESGREEDDTIEYKAGFSGGKDAPVADLNSLNKDQKNNAFDDIAREVVAFLNTRGGDIIIGANEASGDNPAFESIRPVENIFVTAKQLDNALADIIEPKQALIGVKPVPSDANGLTGVIVVRAPSSVRAPHWAKRRRDCTIRRGSKSVSMQMDEIQDVTLGRAMRRNERNAVMDGLFDGMASGQVGTHQLPERRFHIRVAFVPFAAGEIELSRERLEAMTGSDREIYRGDIRFHDSMAFRYLPEIWRPILRGKQKEYFERNNLSSPPEVEFARKTIRSDGVMASEFSRFTTWNAEQPYVFAQWLIGFLANTLRSMQGVVGLSPTFGSGALRIAWAVGGEMDLVIGERWSERYRLPVGLTTVPDFEILAADTFDGIFEQLQKDLFAVVGKETPGIWSLCRPA